MAGKSIADPKTMVDQYYDAQVVSAAASTPGADTTPSNGAQKFWSAVTIVTAGTLKVDTLGVGGAFGQTGLLLPVIAGKLNLAITKIYSGANGTTALGIVGLY